MNPAGRTWQAVVPPLLGVVLPAAFVATHPDMLQAYLGLAWMFVPAAAAATGTAVLLRRVAEGRRVSGVVALLVPALPCGDRGQEQ